MLDLPLYSTKHSLATIPLFLRIIVSPAGYLRALRALCKKHNVLLICDEIQTEFVWEHVWREPLEFAASITALQVLLNENLSARAPRLGEVFRTAVKALNFPFIQTVRDLGLLNAVVIDEERCNAARRARGLDVEGSKRRTVW
ncbi:pyridoxal phosphate-dependent transferase [Mycena sanguinolenta]|nr:pyridoxal phosphate-dependent transferase [Mycena sanguinolenta]